MAIYRILGNAFVSNEELIEKTLQGKIKTFNSNLSKNANDALIEFRNGKLDSNNLIPRVNNLEGSVSDFVKIGPGKPLTIQIRHVYTGAHPKKTFFDNTKDLLITSAIKSIADYSGAPRALNFIKKDISNNHNLTNATATEDGTPLVYYTPALTETNSTLTFEMGFDEYPNEFFDVISKGLVKAAGIPLFISASTHLLAASSIIKVANDLARNFFDKAPVFQASESIFFTVPGEEIPTADFRLITEDNVNVHKVFQKFQLSPNGLIDKNGNQYVGDIPYIIISLDGRKNDEYKDFIPTAASSSALNKFYNIKEGEEITLDPLIDALTVYNDYKYRLKVDEIKEDLDKIEDKESKEYLELNEKYEANLKNILGDLLQP